MIVCTESEDEPNPCPANLYCDYEAQYCKIPTTSLCDSSSDCGDTQYCDGQRCIEGVLLGTTCSDDAQCGKVADYYKQS